MLTCKSSISDLKSWEQKCWYGTSSLFLFSYFPKSGKKKRSSELKKVVFTKRRRPPVLEVHGLLTCMCIQEKKKPVRKFRMNLLSAAQKKISGGKSQKRQVYPKPLSIHWGSTFTFFTFKTVKTRNAWAITFKHADVEWPSWRQSEMLQKQNQKQWEVSVIHQMSQDAKTNYWTSGVMASWNELSCY